MVKEEEEKEKAKRLLKKKKWADLQHALYNPNYKDLTLLDEDADEWLIRLNSYQYSLERSSQETERRYVVNKKKKRIINGN